MKTILLNIILLISYASYGKTLEFNSGEEKVSLLELYTSQSCSSCPPAERWLSSFNKNAELWKKFVPISFHVTYWNHLDWRDTYSKDEFNTRQRNYNRVLQAGVYTPQFILDGRDYRAWRRYGLRLESSTDKVGNLRAEYEKGKVSLHFKSTKFLKSKLICHGASLLKGGKTNVLSGENEGVSIQQDFIVDQIVSIQSKKVAKEYTCSFNLKESKLNHAVAFWVSESNSHKVIQATGGELLPDRK